MTERLIALVRHAKTDFNVSGHIMGGAIDMGTIEGQGDMFELTEKLQYLKKKLFLQSDEIVIISSPLKRCVQTAGVVSQSIGCQQEEIIYDTRLMETDMGEFTGKKANKLRAEYGALVDQWMHTPESFRFPNGESYGEVKDRCLSMLDLVKGIQGKRLVVLVSHVDIIKMMICLTQGKSFNTRRDFSIPNASVSVLVLNDNGELLVKDIDLQIAG